MDQPLNTTQINEHAKIGDIGDGTADRLTGCQLVE